MTPVKPEKLDPVLIRRVLDTVAGIPTGRHVVYFAGIHGNEPAGITALQRVMDTIDRQKTPFYGKLWALEGNLPALRQNVRFIDKDLNRIWFTKLDDAENYSNNFAEVQQRKEIIDEIKNIIDEVEEEVIFFDLHTTSSQSIPFVSISDTLRNRDIVEGLPVPLVLGLEEQMEGTLFSFFSEVGISMVLFEAGKHDLASSVDSHEAFIWLTLLKLEFIKPIDFPNIHEHYEFLAKEGIFEKHIFELKFKFSLTQKNTFVMEPGFVNFQKIKKDQVLAKLGGEPIIARNPGRIFMPLYQEQGEEGFFIINEVRPFWLKISESARKMRLDRFLNFLPGVRRFGDDKEAFIIHRLIAKFTIIPIFHLLGYRKVIRHDKRFIVKRRPYDWTKPSLQKLKAAFYKMVSWH